METIKYLLSVARLWIQTNRENIWIFSLIIAFYYYGQVSRSVDHGASPIDIGALAGIILDILLLIVAKKLTWYLLRVIWPDLHHYIKNEFSTDFKNLEPWQKLKISLCAYAALVFSLIMAFKS